MGRALRRLTWRRWLAVLLGLVAAVVVLLYPKWKENGNNGGQKYAEPFRIAGNFYYVGASDVASFLTTGPQGHVLIDGGYPGTAPMITASIAKLGFDIRDVKVLLNSEPHFDHAGGLAALQRASGAELWASEASADAIESGGDDPDVILPLRALFKIGILGYPAARVDHRFKDGARAAVGPVPQVRRARHGEGPGGPVHRPRGLPRLHRQRRGETPQGGRAVAAGALTSSRARPHVRRPIRR